MIACCSDGTRPVIFRIERLDYYAVHFSSPLSDTDFGCVKTAIESVPGVTGVRREEDFVEVYVDAAPPAELDIRSAVGDLCGIRRID